MLQHLQKIDTRKALKEQVRINTDPEGKPPAADALAMGVFGDLGADEFQATGVSLTKPYSTRRDVSWREVRAAG